MESSSQHRFLLLDFGRGLAAIAVLFWHYQHFYFPFAESGPYFKDWSELPFYPPFQYLFRYGYVAVQFFWVLSGFVLANAYWKAKGTAGNFFIKRFSRIYPLHFLTLIVVAILQGLSWQLTGHFQIYKNNDWYHFILQMFLASDWGFQNGYSYNAPIWSVSLEVVIYFVFFVSLPILARARYFSLIAVAVFFAFNLFQVPGPFWWCGFYFFFGVSCYNLWQWLSSRFSLRYAFGGAFFLAGATSLYFVEWSGSMREFDINLFYVGLALTFGGLILLLATVESLVPNYLLQKTRWLGDASFGIYLWHIPFQILALTIIQSEKLDISIVSNSFFFFGFFICVITFAHFSFKWFERPWREKLRSRPEN